MLRRQWKAIAGALSGALVAFVPVLVGTISGSDPTPDQVTNLQEGLQTLATAVGGAVVSWIIVYWSPKNEES